MRPIFCGNLDFDARQSDVERLFKKYGNVERVDMKSGFAFVHMEDERDADAAIRRLDRIEFGRKGSRIRVEWTKQDRGAMRTGSSRRSPASTNPSRTLFVINFDPEITMTRDLEKHFEPYGRISNVRIRNKFGFVQFEDVEDAIKALGATHKSNFMDRVLSVEYSIRDQQQDNRRGGNMSPDRAYDRRRSPSPYRRNRGSPDYGHGSIPSSRAATRGSPDYGRAHSPIKNRYRSRSPPLRRRS